MMKSRRMKGAAHLTLRGRNGMDFVWKDGREETTGKNVDVGEMIILKWILDRVGWYEVD
jgi:hypothetical protein